MAVHEELEARILAHPDDLEAYVIYSDWLSGQGDPRGELVAVQLALASGPTDALRAREAKLMLEHGFTWLDELLCLDDADVGVTWRHGFVHAVRLGAARP